MTLNLDEALPDAAVLLDEDAATWQDAVGAAGRALVASGATTGDYTAQMITTVEQLGPYIVIAPGIAIAHSRPSEAVLRSGLSWVRLREPVAFGHPSNDPVRLVIGLAATDHDAHLDVMSSIASALVNPEIAAQLATAATPSRIRELLAQA